MAPQGIGKYINSSFSKNVTPEDFRPEVQQAAEYGNAMTKAARKFQLIIVTAWASSFLFIFTQRLIRQDKPFEINMAGKTLIELPKPGLVPEKWVKHLDNILFTLNFTLLSYLFALQYVQYGMIKTKMVSGQ